MVGTGIQVIGMPLPWSSWHRINLPPGKHIYSILMQLSLAFRTVEQSPRPIPGAIAVHLGDDATALM
jgi:hypothetical protein